MINAIVAEGTTTISLPTEQAVRIACNLGALKEVFEKLPPFMVGALTSMAADQMPARARAVDQNLSRWPEGTDDEGVELEAELRNFILALEGSDG